MKEPTEARTLRYHQTYQKATGNQGSTGKSRSGTMIPRPPRLPGHGMSTGLDRGLIYPGAPSAVSMVRPTLRFCQECSAVLETNSGKWLP